VNKKLYGRSISRTTGVCVNIGSISSSFSLWQNKADAQIFRGENRGKGCEIIFGIIEHMKKYTFISQKYMAIL
jgi:hypothetical protein